MDIERGSLCPENKSNAVRGGSAAWSVVRWSFRFFAAVNKAFPVLASGGDGWTSKVSAFASLAALSATRVSALGVIPDPGGRVSRVRVKQNFLRTSKGIRQPHQSPEYKLVRV